MKLGDEAMGVKNLIKRILVNRNIKKNENYIQIGSDTFMETTFNLRLTEPIKDKKYLIVGRKSVVGGNIIFETEQGSLTVGNRTQISGGATIICRSDDAIGDDVIIAGGVLLYDHDSHSIDFKYRKNDVVQLVENHRCGINPIANKDWNHVKTAKIVIKDKAWIGRNVIILKGVTIGEGAVVGAGSVVTHDIPDWVVVAGNPAKVVKIVEH